MNRIIKGISEQTAARILDELTTRAITCTVMNEASDLVDVLLDDYVIVKCLDSELILDLAGRKTVLNYNEFIEFTLG